MSTEMWTSFGSLLASLMFILAMINQHFSGNLLGYFLQRLIHKFLSYLNPYIEITFHEYSRDSFDRSSAYVSIERYLAVKSSATATRLKANSVRDSERLVLSMDDYEEIVDEYQGIKVWWTSGMTADKGRSISFYPRENEKRHFVLSFRKKHREVIVESYLKHVMDEGKAIAVRNRTRKLFTNNKEEGYAGSVWTHVAFVHPATFETLALEPGLKEEIVNDLLTFSQAKDFYGNVGRAWKRGYLLHGPPGTGKSTMVAAMANLLEYDVYDLELTSVENNTELRKLLINTTGKSIIVIEDIDCSLDLTGQRNEEKKEAESSNARDRFKKAEGKDKKTSKVTLSGLLNFIDGLWSACGSERIFVFTTNYIEKLDPALIRTGRMDKHILMSYCSFEVFKVLANKYLNIRFHELFVRIQELLGEVAVTPAQVVEYLIPKSPEDDGERCLYGLVCALENAKVALREHLAAQEAPQEHGGGLNFCLGPV
ncbi:hypothetical protein DCAR_0417897 [Daucus carota subsp. sativus]|uniref:AAA+ ATPase domain-containing protein n=1 Tax=Daucus carota subsp. sativus TaxID=79200 RepID=A0AAF0X1J8_DAUCS|nr:PREDICTED: AAA-ATPase At3g28580-like [Daucus carota subsp. sativus]WOG98553.1 hypothetical protein DCAR_0417897 [Daucus carota subsp. sativus]